MTEHILLTTTSTQFFGNVLVEVKVKVAKYFDEYKQLSSAFDKLYK